MMLYAVPHRGYSQICYSTRSQSRLECTPQPRQESGYHSDIYQGDTYRPMLCDAQCTMRSITPHRGIPRARRSTTIGPPSLPPPPHSYFTHTKPPLHLYLTPVHPRSIQGVYSLASPPTLHVYGDARHWQVKVPPHPCRRYRNAHPQPFTSDKPRGILLGNPGAVSPGTS